jgi:uncharacterized repeat protein (TIGR03837 family)
MTTLVWSIFCRVIDNYGDAGVCIRLAKDLASKGQKIKLWIDEPKILQWMAPNLDPNIEILDWPIAPFALALEVDVVLEAFGCSVPDFVQEVIAGSISEKPKPSRFGHETGDSQINQRIQWINLEYLSAQSYASNNHGLHSPVLFGIAQGAVKWFYYPGFERTTGGLILERGMRQRIKSSELTPSPETNSFKVGLFSYPQAPIVELLAELKKQNKQSGTPCSLRVAGGQTQIILKKAFLPFSQNLSATNSEQGLEINYLPYVSQDEFDNFLWSNDINFVRGEDSLVRAIWSAKPWVWQIYPQEDNIHLEKLNALLDLLDAPAFVKKIHWSWNCVPPSGANIPSFELNLPDLGDQEKWTNWQEWCCTARSKLLELGNLTDQLLYFVLSKRQKTVE